MIAALAKVPFARMTRLRRGWLPILGYYGYATFLQSGITYHATH